MEKNRHFLTWGAELGAERDDGSPKGEGLFGMVEKSVGFGEWRNRSVVLG